MILRDRLTAQIRASGPMSVAQYMHVCLHDPDHGYYATRPALGEAGDFITAPELTPVFARTLGAQAWQILTLSAPHVIEVGAGSGRLAAALLLDEHPTPLQWLGSGLVLLGFVVHLLGGKMRFLKTQTED